MLGIVLSRHDFREADQRIILLTAESGKQEYLARGVKKSVSKLSGFLEPPSLVEIEAVPTKESKLLIQAEPIELFKGIRSDLTKSALASCALNFIDENISVGERDQRLFTVLQSWLFFLEAGSVISNSLLESFLLQVVRLLGFEPVLDVCVSGGEEILVSQPIFFDISLGGVLCANCATQKKNLSTVGSFVSLSVVAELKKLLEANNWNEINALTLSPLTREIVYQFIGYHLGKKIPRCTTW